MKNEYSKIMLLKSDDAKQVNSTKTEMNISSTNVMKNELMTKNKMIDRNNQTIEAIRKVKSLNPKFYNFLINDNSNFTDLEKLETSLSEQNLIYKEQFNNNNSILDAKKQQLDQLNKKCKTVIKIIILILFIFIRLLVKH